ncbi:MAG: IS110 family transposase [Dehalococcoidia bacterium]|nr:IS110 family transposase [Dehalococcoidia bacterium]
MSSEVITVGVDAHKAVHVAIALDEAGHRIGEWSGANTVSEWARFGEWLRSLGGARQVGIEGAGSYGRGLAVSLVHAGEVVYDVNGRLTALGRRHARRRGKSDSLDAEAVAHTVRREADALPRVVCNDDARILSHLSEERETLVHEATRVRNRLHAVLLELDPEYKQWASLLSRQGLSALEALPTDPEDDALRQALRASVRRHAAHLAMLMRDINELAKEIETRAQPYAALTEITGVAPLTAGTLAGIIGSHAPFANDAQLAAYAGVAPLEASSAGNGRHRLNRGGNRRLNAIVYRIAIGQLRHPGEGRAFLDKKLCQGHTKKEAIRSLKRYIVRAIWRHWRRCPPQTSFACL